MGETTKNKGKKCGKLFASKVFAFEIARVVFSKANVELTSGRPSCVDCV